MSSAAVLRCPPSMSAFPAPSSSPCPSPPSPPSSSDCGSSSELPPPSPSAAAGSIAQPGCAGVSFSSLARYVKLEKLGEGNYGCVYKARDEWDGGRVVALKKIKFVGEDNGVPCTAVREISVLQALRHEAVVPLLDVIFSLDHLYLAFPFYDKDVRRYMDCVGDLHPMAVKWYMLQLLRGLQHCHSHRVLHRDLKPQNLLINRRGELQLADFGLARTIAWPHSDTMTHDVATLWYRAPEILLGQKVYTEAMDLWAVGCIFAELSNDAPLFAGDSEIATLFKIFQLTGSPCDRVWPGVSGLADFHSTFPNWRAASLSSLQQRFPALDAFGLDLLQRFLTLDPTQRLSARAALCHPYFADLDVQWARELSEKAAVQLDLNDGSERRRRRHARR